MRVGVLSVGGQEMRKRALLGWACRIDRWICTWDVAHVGMIPRNGAHRGRDVDGFADLP